MASNSQNSDAKDLLQDRKIVAKYFSHKEAQDLPPNDLEEMAALLREAERDAK